MATAMVMCGSGRGSLARPSGLQHLISGWTARWLEMTRCGRCSRAGQAFEVEAGREPRQG
jgi:hypothetical protein